MQPLRAVFDCTVFLQALINPRGPAGACLSAAQEGKVRLFVSGFVLLEIRELPPKLPAKLGVTPDRVARFLLDLAKYTEPVAQVPVQFTYDRDPDDAHYVNLAVAARATFLVARDKDLHDLMRLDDFRRRFPDLRIVSPPEFMRELALQDS